MTTPIAGPAWLAARTGLPGDSTAVNEPSQVSQFLAAHGITPVYPGTQIIIPAGNGAVTWISLGTSDVDQPFTMPGGETAAGRVTLPLSPAGNGADVTVSLCADSGGNPGTVLASTRLPAAWLAQLAAPSGLSAAGPLATAASNAMAAGAGTSTAWSQAAVTLNGAGTYATPVTSGNYTILLGGYDTVTSLPSAAVSAIAYAGGTAVTAPVPQPSLPKGAWAAQAAATGTTLVFAGGLTGASAYTASTWTASWDPSTGTVGAWTAQAALPAATISGGMAAWQDTVYLAGGVTSAAGLAVASVWYASAVNQQIQSWTAGPPLPAAVSDPFTAVIGNWLVVAGGLTTAGAVVDSAWYAPIGPDGTPGAWLPGPSLPVPASCYSPGWDLAVTDTAMVIINGLASGGGNTDVTQALTFTADGPAPAWQAADCFAAANSQAGCYPAGGGTWQAFAFFPASYTSASLIPLPVISVPLPATGLTPGGTYHILCHQDGGDLNDYAQIAVAPSALTAAGQARPSGGGSWTTLPGSESVIAGAWDQAPGGPLLHTWEDSGTRIMTLICGGAYGELLGLCEATAFEDGSMLAAVTQVTYAGTGQPSGTVQLA